MVKVKAGQIPGFIKAPPPDLCAVLLYGPDSGLVRERAAALSKTVVEDLSDPFRVSTLTGKEISEDSLRLADEAGALALTGGRRVVRVKEASEGISRPLAGLLEAPISDTFIVIEAGDLPPRSGLRKLAESAGNAAAIPCYADEGQSLQMVIMTTLGQAGLEPDRDAMDYLMAHLGSDRQITLSELEKVCLYMGPQNGPEKRPVTGEDVAAVVGDSAAHTVDDAVRATAMGQPAAMEQALDRAFTSGLPSIQVIRAHLRHFQRLHLVAGHMQSGMSIDAAMNTLTPRVFFKDQGPFRQQTQMWGLKKVSKALELLEEAEITCKTTGMPDLTICRRTLLRLARAAKNA